MNMAEKLQEVSVSLSIIDYLGLKGLAKAKHMSLSHVIRAGVHPLMIHYQDTHGRMFQELGKPIILAQRDHNELSIPPFDYMSICEVDAAATEIEQLMCELESTTEEKLKCTINVSLSFETVRSIKRLVNRKIFVTQSELLRAAIRDILHEHIFPYMTATTSTSWQHDTEPAVILAKNKASFCHE